MDSGDIQKNVVPFLKQVAHFCYEAGDIGKKCFVFPSRRSCAFFKMYLCEEVASGQVPLIAPGTFTVNDFFSALAGVGTADRISQLLTLYDCYRELYPNAEPLDDFIFWGDVLLSDFNDVDKYRVEARSLFVNVSSFKRMQDSFDYLTEGQKEAIERFLSHFRGTDPSAGTGVKDKFLRIWDILLPLYENFRKRLRARGLGYEGMVYRDLSDRFRNESAVDILSERFPGVEKFVFVGLNALNECEKVVLRSIEKAGLAEFCWDYSSEMIKDPGNRSSVFLKDNVLSFPQLFKPDADAPLSSPSFHVVGVPSCVAQPRQLPWILERIACEQHCGDVSAIGKETAVVLSDENLLLPVLNSIPPQIGSINVTMGYPMKGSEFHSLMDEVASLQMHSRVKGGEKYFYHKQVWAIFSNSVLRCACSEDETALMDKVKEETLYYIPERELRGGGELFNTIFECLALDLSARSSEQVKRISGYQKRVIVALAPKIRKREDMVLELDFAMEYYKAVNRLGSYTLDIVSATYFSLLSQIVTSSTVPFNGEPLSGLQVMGPLETRALDFRNLIILSCNEGAFPRRSVPLSFIPPELRRGFDLPTYEYQDAVWAYYFYRMIQRAENVWMVYDSRPDNPRYGEESRYIKQLEMHFKKKMDRFGAVAPVSAGREDGVIPKTASDVEKVRATELSATALQHYLACPAKFYYSVICGLSAEGEVAESLDAGMIGNVFHKAMQSLYTRPDNVVTAAYVKALLSDAEGLRTLVRRLALEQLKAFEIEGRNIILCSLVTSYVVKTLERDLEHMEDCHTDRFKVLGLELRETAEIHGFRFKGFVDRLDSFREGEVRIVDYKTGRVEESDVNVTDDTAEEIVESLFAEVSPHRPKIALQLYLYDMLTKDRTRGATVVNSIYPAGGLFTDKVRDVPLSREFCSLMEKRLPEKLDEMVDVSVPFRRTSDAKTCEYCDFKSICSR